MAVLQQNQRESQSLRQSQYVPGVIAQAVVRIPDIRNINTGVCLDGADELVQIGERSGVVGNGNGCLQLGKQSNQLRLQR